MALTGPALLLTAITPASFPLPSLIAGGILAGFGAVVYNIAQVSLRRAITPGVDTAGATTGAGPAAATDR